MASLKLVSEGGLVQEVRATMRNTYFGFVRLMFGGEE
jgi:hypothetical protein